MKHSTQSGLSIIELMVALALSSFLILGITQVYISNKSNYLFQQSQAGNLDNTRFLQMILDDQIGKAGYFRAPNQQFAEYAFPARDARDACSAFPVEGVVTRLKDKTELGFCFRYQPAVQNEIACDGTTPRHLSHSDSFVRASADDQIVVAIKLIPANDLHLGKIACKAFNYVDDSSTKPFVDIVEGVADLKVEFVKGKKHDRQILTSDTYIDAASYESSDSDAIRGLRYSVLLASVANQRNGSSATFNDWIDTLPENSSNTTRLTSNDNNRIYQTASNTNTLRNLMP